MATSELVVSEPVMKSWQEIVDILAAMIDVPAALIMRYRKPRIEVFVAGDSDGNPYKSGESEELFGSGLYCETVIRTGSKLLVPDSLADDHWKDNPDVKLNMISYLGFPIRYPNGDPFGTLCVLDKKRNTYSEKVEKLMEKFRSLIESQIEILHINQVLGYSNARPVDLLPELQALRGVVPICASCKAIRDKDGQWHPIESYIGRKAAVGLSHGICPDCMKRLYPESMETQDSGP